MQKKLTFSILFILLLGFISLLVLFNFIKPFYDEPANLPSAGYTFSVKQGESLQMAARRLSKDNIITYPKFLSRWVWWTQGRPSIQKGDYYFPQGTTPIALFRMMTEGKQMTYRLTIIPGQTYHEIYTLIKNTPKIKQTLPEDPKLAAKALGILSEHIEGWLFAESYDYTAGTTDKTILKMAYTQMKTKLDEAWYDRALSLPLQTPYEALILASIVQEESYITAEQPMVAAVFLNRLSKKMRLQADPTVIYGMGQTYDGNIRSKDLKAKTPYNTYVIKGLPPTPIGTISQNALVATLHPAQTKALYFVADGKGGHKFSQTLKQHNRAVKKYLQNLKNKRHKN